MSASVALPQTDFQRDLVEHTSDSSQGLDRTRTSTSLSSRSSARNNSTVASSELITYIIPDFNAVKYFHRDFVVSNEFHLVEEATASGVDLYLVEQWVHNRRIGTIAATYTGNSDSKADVVRFTIIRKHPKHYPLKFQEYLNEVMLNHGKMKRMEQPAPNLDSSSDLPAIDAPHEFLFVTNVAALPSNLNLIPIEAGDARSIETPFVVNSNLKKLHCSGRSLSLITDKIPDANEDKFRSLYCITNEEVPIKFALRELVNIIQTCLFYFDLLDAKYCDGLLCNKTEEAIQNWWNLIGLPHFNVKPNPKNGILPSRTVSAILSLTLSVKLRLQMIGGCDVPRDPLDFENFMISIGQFQKQYKLEKRRKLDWDTMNKLLSTTNSKFSPDKSKVHNPYVTQSPHDSLYDSTKDSSVSSNQLTNGSPYLNITTPIKGSSLLYPVSSIANMSSSSYKRNKTYYSKEIKKLTNVVKSTVQDHISARDVEDSFYSSPSKSSGGRIRNRIAKLADIILPHDVETLELEVLVKNHLVGKTLFRLFYGASKPGHTHMQLSTSYNSTSNRRPSDFGRHSGALQLASKQYQFVSLKEVIAKNQLLGALSSPNDASRYSRGLNKMKLGLQGRRNFLLPSQAKKPYSTKLESNNTSYNGLTEMTHDLSVSTTGENYLSNDVCTKNKNLLPNKTRTEYCLVQQLTCQLNRRNSWPCAITQGESNLNYLEFLRDENLVQITESRKIKRSSSFSNLEDYFIDELGLLVSVEKLSKAYLRSMNMMIQFDKLKEECSSDPKNISINNRTLQNGHRQLNLELIKLSNVHGQMVAYKTKVMDEDLSEILAFKIHDLNATIDKLIYETRIVVQRINELEEDSKLLDVKLNDECLKKLSLIVNNLVYLNRFKTVFSNDEERDQLVVKLTGKNEKELESHQSKSSVEDHNWGYMRLVAMFIYDLVAYVFGVFKFDRSKMNLDRIRQSWGKLDPNREYINQVYNFVGREPSRHSSVVSLKGED